MSCDRADSAAAVGVSGALGSADAGGFAGAGRTADGPAAAGLVESTDAAGVFGIAESTDAGYAADDSDVAGGAYRNSFLEKDGLNKLIP